MRLWHLCTMFMVLLDTAEASLGSTVLLTYVVVRLQFAHRLFVDIPVYIGPGAGLDVDLLYDACTFLR